MKYKLETIPVWDALHKKTECLFCYLMKNAKKRYIEYYLGSSVMNPETRVKVNSVGFCPEHYSDLANAEKPQPMSLITHTHLLETRDKLKPYLDKLKNEKSPGKTGKHIVEIRKVLLEREKGCLICESMQTTLNRYTYTFVHLWGNDEEFRTAFLKSKSICLHHLPAVLDMAGNALKKKQLSEFFSEIIDFVEKSLEKSIHDVYWMTQMYKSENRDKDWKGCQDAQKRAVNRELGIGRIFSK
ncbi:MAG: hypothetical protein KAQ69_05885 [Spirochaetales bacterium]|nr:hypothetical protein [Spirochaetales bacterium]